MDHAHIVEQNHVALRLTFATLMIIAGWLVYAGVRVTLFNIPMRILGLTISARAVAGIVGIRIHYHCCIDGDNSGPCLPAAAENGLGNKITIYH